MINVDVIDKGDLTAQEANVLKLLCANFGNKLIAKELGITVKTVDTHLQRIYVKLHVQNKRVNARCAAITHAIAAGMVKVSLLGVMMVMFVQHDAMAMRTMRSAQRVATRQVAVCLSL